MSLFHTTAQNPDGFNAGQMVTARITSAATISQGQLMALTSLTAGTIAATTHKTETLLCVALEDISKTGKGRVAIRGQVPCLLTANIATFTSLTAASTGTFAASTGGQNVCAKTLTGGTTSGTLVECLFDGGQLGVGS